MRHTKCRLQGKLGGCHPLILLFKVGFFQALQSTAINPVVRVKAAEGGSWAAAGCCAVGNGDSNAACLVGGRWDGTVGLQQLHLHGVQGMCPMRRGGSLTPRGAVGNAGHAKS